MGIMPKAFNSIAQGREAPPWVGHGHPRFRTPMGFYNSGHVPRAARGGIDHRAEHGPTMGITPKAFNSIAQGRAAHLGGSRPSKIPNPHGFYNSGHVPRAARGGIDHRAEHGPTVGLTPKALHSIAQGRVAVTVHRDQSLLPTCGGGGGPRFGLLAIRRLATLSVR